MSGGQGAQNGKGAQSDPNYLSRLIRLYTGISQNHYPCMPSLLYRSGLVDKCMCQCGDNVKVSLLVWRTRYTGTFRSAVDCRFELALEVQRWTRARSECLPGAQKL